MDNYEILGVSRNSSLDEIKKGYRIKAHENHPDKGGDESSMKLINHAYHELLHLTIIDYHPEPTAENYNRPINKCEKCGKDTHYTLCLDCWIKLKKEEKKKRMNTIRSFMFCLNCDKTLYSRHINTIFCDDKCSREYYKKRGRVNPESKHKCSHNGKGLNEEESYRLKRLDIEKIIKQDRKVRIAIFTRLIGKDKATWLDSEIQKNFKT